MKGVDFSKFKRVSSDKKSTTLRHPDGHELTVSHASLSPKNRAALAALPKHEGKEDKQAMKMADGGQVPDNSGKTVGEIIGFPGSTKPKKMAEGGEVKKEQPKKEADRSPAGKGIGADIDPENPVVKGVMDVFNKGKVKNYAFGGMEEGPDSQPQMGQGTTHIGTININAGGGGGGEQQPAMPAGDPNQALTAALGNVLPNKDAAKEQAIASMTAAYGAPPPEVAAQLGVETPAAPQMTQAGVPAAAPTQTPPSAVMPSGPKSPSDPLGTEALKSTVLPGIEMQQEGIAGQAKASMQMADEQAKIYHQQQAQLQSSMRQIQNLTSHYEDQTNSLIEDIKAQHIDPTRLFREQSTGQKISTAIGLLLGGMAGGVLGQENPVLKMIQDQQNKDIDAQKAELGKRENLLSANFKHFGNMKDALAMTQAQMNALTASKIMEAAAKAGGPQALANAQIAAGKLLEEKSGIISQIAIRQSLGGGEAQKNPGRFIEFALPQAEKDNARKELKEFTTIHESKKQALDAFDQLDKMNLTLNPNKAAALREPIVAKISKETAGRFTEQDAKMLESLFPSRSDMGAETRKIKRRQLEKLFADKLAPNNFSILSTYNLIPSENQSSQPKQFNFKPKGK